MLEDIFEKNIIIPLWPVYVDGKFFEGSKVSKSKLCSFDCIKQLNGTNINQCEHGLSHISKSLEGASFVVSGVYISQSFESKKINRKYKNQKASIVQINNWMQEVESKFEAINSISNRIAKNKFDQFHEFAKWANEINYYSNRLVNKSKSKHVHGFESANEDLKSLYKTSIMLMDSLDTSSIYFNPASAAFGHKRATDIYSMLHKISLVLSHSKSNKGRIKIPLTGQVDNKHKVYESFKVIPLSFIQNALKYRKGNDVEVNFTESGKELCMSVVSYGDLIPKNELPSLFERGYRTTAAKKSNLEGNGLGLYVAKIVADAHDFELSVSSEYSCKNTRFAKNKFTVFIR